MSCRPAVEGTRSNTTTSPRSPARRKLALGFTAMPSTAQTAPPVEAGDPAAPLRQAVMAEPSSVPPRTCQEASLAAGARAAPEPFWAIALPSPLEVPNAR